MVNLLCVCPVQNDIMDCCLWGLVLLNCGATICVFSCLMCMVWKHLVDVRPIMMGVLGEVLRLVCSMLATVLFY